jgi:alkylated DNA repair protein (DNA oxidative demethylase)
MTLHKLNDLFDVLEHVRRESIAHGVVILHGFGLEVEQAIIDALRLVVTASPFRHMTMPGGH